MHSNPLGRFEYVPIGKVPNLWLPEITALLKARRGQPCEASERWIFPKIALVVKSEAPCRNFAKQHSPMIIRTSCSHMIN